MATTEPSINIPVNIRVTDVNDNAPIFLNSPYAVTLSEVLMVGTVINADIKAVDEDQAGPFSTVQYFIMPGPNSHHFAFQSPLRGELVLKRPLDYETEPLFNITIMAQDQGLSAQNSTTVLTVQVLDADDQNPVFRSERYMAVLPEIPTKGSTLEVKPESLLAEDKDEGIKSPIIYSLAGAEDDSYWFNIDPTTGVITLDDDIPDQILIQPTILLIKAVQEDNPDRQGVTTLTVSRSEHFSTKVQFLQREYITAVPESLSVNSVIMSTRINKNIDEKMVYSLEDDGMGVFHITPSGKVILKSPLDYEEAKNYKIRIYVNDEKSNDTALLKVDILNVNDWDPQFEHESYEFYVESADLRPGDFIGKVRVTDNDFEDHVSLSVMGDDERMFSINDIGEIMIQDVSDLNSTEVNLIVMAKDSLTPSRTSSVPVTIQFPDNMVLSLPLGQGSSWLLMLVFGSVLIVFVIVIICLVIYIHKNKKKERDEKTTANSMMNQNGTLSRDPIPDLHQALKGLIPMTTATVRTRSPIPVQSPVPPDFTYQETNNNLAKGSVRSHNGSDRSEQSIHNTGKVQYRNGLVPAATVFPNSHRPTYKDSISLNGSINGSAKSYATTITVNSCRIPSTLHYARTPLPFFYKNEPESDKTTSFRDHTMGEARAIGGLPTSKVSPVRNATSPDRATGSISSTDSTPSTPSREFRSDTPLDYDEVWPKGSSGPRRTKKLSWEDEQNSQVELDPEESVEPISSSSSSNELTVYF
ncbi:unnamed protein product [Meganyctiphanes norvegica]|uniref:Cadherin domain-containing protein n=1 Tax=Meganyctiphanes norvegica TaxID=48144 RepID=A0AAV2QDM5_MEGNR